MKKKILRRIKSLIAVSFSLDFLYGRRSFSQEGEDLILEKIFDYKKKGFFVDVGAHHPYRYSNTQRLYKKGWQGINIDPIKDTKKVFDKVRKRDINLEKAIGNGKEKTFYLFADQALNTFSKKNAKQTIKTQQSRLVKKRKVKTYKLSSVLDKHLPLGKKISLLNIDAEGAELEILRSNNWQKYKPKVIAVEILPKERKVSRGRSAVHRFLLQKGYKQEAGTLNTTIFQIKTP